MCERLLDGGQAGHKIFRAFTREVRSHQAYSSNRLIFFLKCDSRCLTHAPPILGGVRAPLSDPPCQRCASATRVSRPPFRRRNLLGRLCSDAAIRCRGLLRHHGACFANEAERRIFCALSRCCLEVRSLSEVKTTLKSSSVGKALAEALSSTSTRSLTLCPGLQTTRSPNSH